MSYEEELKNNFKNLEVEILQDIVKNKKDEYTEEAYKIAVNELKNRTSEEFINDIINQKINNSNRLNLVYKFPDDNWECVFTSIVSNEKIIYHEQVNSVIDLFEKNNITYISYGTLEQLSIFVNTFDFECAYELLSKNNLIFNKSLEEIAEFKGVDIETPIEDDGSYNKWWDNIDIASVFCTESEDIEKIDEKSERIIDAILTRLTERLFLVGLGILIYLLFLFILSQ